LYFRTNPLRVPGQQRRGPQERCEVTRHHRLVARAHGATPAQVRLAWTLAQGNHVLAIPGTGSLTHLAENVAVGALRLTEEDLALLGSLA
jgi:pyridoxine 4-dehydrogenase